MHMSYLAFAVNPAICQEIELLSPGIVVELLFHARKSERRVSGLEVAL
jgi:hypothetical protein